MSPKKIAEAAARFYGVEREAVSVLREGQDVIVLVADNHANRWVRLDIPYSAYGGIPRGARVYSCRVDSERFGAAEAAFRLGGYEAMRPLLRNRLTRARA